MRVVTPFLVASMVAVSTVAAVAVEMVRPIEALEQCQGVSGLKWKRA